MTSPTALLLACLTLLCIAVHDRLARARDEHQAELARRVNAEAVKLTAQHAEAQHDRQMEAIEAQRELNREWIDGQMRLEHPWSGQ